MSADAVMKTVKCITVLEFETCMCKYVKQWEILRQFVTFNKE